MSKTPMTPETPHALPSLTRYEVVRLNNKALSFQGWAFQLSDTGDWVSYAEAAAALTAAEARITALEQECGDVAETVYQSGKADRDSLRAKVAAAEARARTAEQALEEKTEEARCLNEFVKEASRVAGDLFQPGGKYHDRAFPELWGRSTVIDGMKWLDRNLTELENAKPAATGETR